MVFVFLLVMVEAAVTADVFLNKSWEEVRAISLSAMLQSVFSCRPICSFLIALQPFSGFPDRSHWQI